MGVYFADTGISAPAKATDVAGPQISDELGPVDVFPKVSTEVYFTDTDPRASPGGSSEGPAGDFG